MDGCGYHFVIGNGTGSRDGAIEVTRRWSEQRPGAHCRDAAHPAVNEYGIGICLVGDLDAGPPTPKQVESARALVAYLQQRYAIPPERVVTHATVSATPTACPGSRFPTERDPRPPPAAQPGGPLSRAAVTDDAGRAATRVSRGAARCVRSADQGVSTICILGGGDDADQLVDQLLRDLELLERGDEVAGHGVELGLGDPHPLVDRAHRAAGVLERAAGGRADELDEELLEPLDPGGVEG